MTELYIKHRPRSWKRVVGQIEAVAMLRKMTERKKVKHAMLFTGPSGCGKNTLAYILRKKLGCTDDDFKEYNCADFRGIDTVRAMRRKMHIHPWGDCYVILIDEAHQLSYDAQQAILKVLENTPSHVYFFLLTTNPDKLDSAILTRCTEIKVRLLSPAEIHKVLKTVCRKEGFKLSEELSDAVVEAADGSARKALVILDQVKDLKSEKARLQSVIASDSKLQANKIFQVLMTPKVQWVTVAKTLKLLGDDPEKVRHYVLACCANIMVSGSKASAKAYKIINAFRDPFYESRKAGLIAACFEAIH